MSMGFSGVIFWFLFICKRGIPRAEKIPKSLSIERSCSTIKAVLSLVCWEWGRWVIITRNKGIALYWVRWLIRISSPHFPSHCCVVPRKSILPFEVRGTAGDCSRVTSGQMRPHLCLCLGPNVPLQGRQGSRGCIPDSPEESGLVYRGRKEFRSPLKFQRVSLGAHRVA